MFATKETSQILLQTLWHQYCKSQINLISLCGDAFTNVGYNLGQVVDCPKTFTYLLLKCLSCINLYYCA